MNFSIQYGHILRKVKPSPVRLPKQKRAPLPLKTDSTESRSREQQLHLHSAMTRLLLTKFFKLAVWIGVLFFQIEMSLAQSFCDAELGGKRVYLKQIKSTQDFFSISSQANVGPIEGQAIKFIYLVKPKGSLPSGTLFFFNKGFVNDPFANV